MIEALVKVDASEPMHCHETSARQAEISRRLASTRISVEHEPDPDPTVSGLVIFPLAAKSRGKAGSTRRTVDDELDQRHWRYEKYGDRHEAFFVLL